MKQFLIWAKGAVSHRFRYLSGAIIGVALMVAFISTLGIFLTVSNTKMTQRTIQNVPVDWQIQLSPNTNISAIRKKIIQAVHPKIIEKVSFAAVKGFTATTNGTVQTTGAGKIVGISAQYFKLFPAEMRPLLGKKQGILLTQQTAANLHASVGTKIKILRIGLQPIIVQVNGIIDLPQADSFFQNIGIPAGIAPQAPPDNVMILPEPLFQKYFDPQKVIHPGSIQTQYHIHLGHSLPNDPNTAYTVITREANNLAAHLAGNDIVSDNLAAALLSVRGDALYAKVLFFFLGLPGVILVIILTLGIANSERQRHIKEQALLRIHGASMFQIIQLVTVEAILVGIGGILLGLILMTVFSWFLLHIHLHQLLNYHVLLWINLSIGSGVFLSLGSVIIPAWTLARQTTVVTARTTIVRLIYTPLWQRMWIDIIILLIGGIEFWRTASSGYQIILAPEGVPVSAVNYEAFIAPICLWTGSILLAFRIITWAIHRGRKVLSHLFALFTQELSILISGSIIRQQSLVTRGIVMMTLAISFAVSIAIFNTTYNKQSRIDAELTNGADVTVTGLTSNPPSEKLTAFRSIPHVVSAQPMQHRFVYVGTDLQDIYGINPHSIGTATNMSDAFFGNHNAKGTLNTLAHTPNGALVSLETVNNFKLHQGDQLNLRLQFANDRQYHIVPFRFIGIVREFPTAPKDSFIVANASYLKQKTGYTGKEIILMRVKGNPVSVTKRARAIAAKIQGSKVTDIKTVQHSIRSSLTAINLQGLTRLELIFAIILVIGSCGLILALGLAQKRRMFAILLALGAKPTQLGAFLWSEGILMLTTSLIIGNLLGATIAQVLVKMLTGIFDPPPETLSIPWNYMALLIIAAILSTVIAVIIIRCWYTRRQVLETIRGL